MYRGVLAYAEERVEGGVAAVAAELPEALRWFYAQPFLAGSWYDVAPIIAFGNETARQSKLGYAELMRKVSIAQAERDTGGVYRVLLALASPDMVMERLPRTAQAYFDFVRSSVARIGDREWRIELHGIPAFAAPTYTVCSAAFIETALRRAGAKEPVVLSEPPEPDGEERGHDVVRIRRTVRWK